MGFVLSKEDLTKLSKRLGEEYVLYGPKRYIGQGEYSDTDSIRYGEIEDLNDLELEEKSSHTFKEILIPMSETLLYFTEDSVKESNTTLGKKALVFVRSCDLHSVRRLDAIYLQNGFEDHYYARSRELVHFALIGCPESFENCFCVDAGTNTSQDYLVSIDKRQENFYMDVKEESFQGAFEDNFLEEVEVTPAFVSENQSRVNFPKNLDPLIVMKSSKWDEYDKRCIACGRCNFSCPTCTCNSMQDIFYHDNPRVGERRRVWSSCMVDGFTDVAGGGNYRQKNGQRMRFKVLHKAYDFKERFGYQMCVGCGRCDDVCPEYISFRAAVNRLEEMSEEGMDND